MGLCITKDDAVGDQEEHVDVACSQAELPQMKRNMGKLGLEFCDAISVGPNQVLSAYRGSRQSAERAVANYGATIMVQGHTC